MLEEIKKQAAELTQQVVDLIENPDIKAEVQADFNATLLIGAKMGLMQVIGLLQEKQSQPMAFSLIEVIKVTNALSVQIAEYEQARKQ